MSALPRSSLVAAAVLAAVTPLAAGESAKPSVISPAQELVLGERSLKAYLDTLPETTDADAAARVDAIGRRLSPVSDRPELSHRAIVVVGDTLQALSFLGGTVAV